MPHIFEDAFKASNKNFNDYVKIVEIKEQWRNIFENGKKFDIVSTIQETSKEIEKLNENPQSIERYYKYSLKQPELIEKYYFKKGHSSLFEIVKDYGFNILKIDWRKTVYKSISNFFETQEVKNAISYFTKYIGSSPYRAPTFMNLLFAVQMKYGLWYVKGGMYRLCDGLKKLATDLGVKFYFNKEVIKIITEKQKAIAIATKEDEFKCDYVISNMEFVQTHTKLLNIDKFENSKKYEPACSGFVIELGVKGLYNNLLHHNFFYSNDYKKSMDNIFKNHTISTDPNIYLVNSTITDSSNAPKGYSVIKILPHVTYITPKNSRDEYMKMEEIIISKLERMGMDNLRSRIVKKHILTPYDIKDMYYSNKDSIYGIVSDIYKNLSFRAPNKSPFFENIYFVGGSTNPGCGMPMAFLNGKILAENNFR